MQEFRDTQSSSEDPLTLRLPTRNSSCAVGLRSLSPNCESAYPLHPVTLGGCPESNNDQVQYPLEVTYDYSRVSPSLFDQAPLPGLRRWQPLLPTLHPALDLKEGGTPLVGVYDPELSAHPFYFKDESRNPTWSHKDRLNVVTTSVALSEGELGVVVASSGNHGASAAAYAAQAGFGCVVIMSDDTAPNLQDFVKAYGAHVKLVPREERWAALREVAAAGYHPVSNMTRAHTGHPFGPEGYKTIAYELYLQLGREVPGAVLVPTGYGELLYGTWKGFKELYLLGLTSTLPKMFACEPEARAPLARAMKQGVEVASVEPLPTVATAIGTTVSSYRGVLAIRESGGDVFVVSDTRLKQVQSQLAKQGLLHEVSSVAGVAGLDSLGSKDIHGEVVCIGTSCGLK